MILTEALWVVAAFLVGSIPFGYVIGRLFYRTDLRASGSGNIGAMNALRTLGRAGAIAVLLLDAGKGYLMVWLVLHSGGWLPAIVGVSVVLGHCFSPWLGWKGGKGVATSFGAIAAMSWPALLAVVIAWALGALVVSRYSSVGSMAANIVAPFALYTFTHSQELAAYGAFAGAFIIWTHRENITRLRAGTEGPITLFKRG